jgi:agmatine/peptidylarginine deiminase
MPAIANSYRTYINSLVVGRTVFMPSYGVPTDSQARAVYESQGYQVIEIRSNTLSDQLRGSIHCQTMAYPQIAEEKLLSLLGLRAVR